VLIGPLDRLDDLLARKIGTEIVPSLDGDIVWVEQKAKKAA
jgi:carbamate kinase